MLRRGASDVVRRNGVKDMAAKFQAAAASPSPAPTRAPVTTGAVEGVEALKSKHDSAAEASQETRSTSVPTTLADVAAMDKAAIERFPTGQGSGTPNPEAMRAKVMLKLAFGSNWFFAKDVLIYNRWPETIPEHLPLRRPENGALREQLMWRLIGLRTWEYNDILSDLRARYEGDEALSHGKKAAQVLDWGSAGSDTPTSDVDLNLKGQCNMQAVADFNAEFVRRGWPYEAGTVYDVNVYCKDNMWDFAVGRESGVMTTTSEPNAPASLPQDKDDSAQQEVAAMIKLIRFLSHSHDLPDDAWNAYKAKLASNRQMMTTVALAESGYRKWYAALTLEKHRISKSADAVVDATLMATDHVHKLEAAIDMRASNRLYEAKIKELIAARQQLAEAATAGVAAEGLLGLARRVRQIVLEAAMFANEAMITAGASQFVVFGTQLGLKKNASGISLTEGQLFHAFTEQLADTIKEFGHFDNLADGLLKGGKYLMRMTLAADQLDGVRTASPPITNLETLRMLGDYAMTGKNMAGTIDAKLSVMQHALTDSGIASDKKTLVAAIAQFGADVTNAYQAAKAGVEVPATPSASDPEKVAKSKAVADAEARKIGAEMRTAKIKGADLSDAIEKLGLGVTKVPAAK